MFPDTKAVVSKNELRRNTKGRSKKLKMRLTDDSRKKQVSLCNRALKTLLSGRRQDVRRCLPAFSNSWHHHPPFFFFLHP